MVSLSHTVQSSDESKRTLFDLSTSLRTRSVAFGSLMSGSRCDRWTSVYVLVPGLRHREGAMLVSILGSLTSLRVS